MNKRINKAAILLPRLIITAAALLLVSLPVSGDEPIAGKSEISQPSAHITSPMRSAGLTTESGSQSAMGVLVDLTLCVGCRACVVACKEWNGLPLDQEDYFRCLSDHKEKTVFVGGRSYTPQLSSDTYTVVEYHDVGNSEGESQWMFVKRQCMHCLEPACESACPVGAFRKTAEGPVVYDAWKCMGCRYCMMACPFGVPTYEWQNAIPFVRKCTFCFNRITNDESLPRTERVPACVKACPANALMFGRRDELLAEAHRRIASNPDKYIDHIYGEHEAGGTSWLYISSAPFDQLGFPTNVGVRPYPEYTDAALDSVPLIIVFGGTILAGLCLLLRGKRDREFDACGPGSSTNDGNSNRPKKPGGNALLFTLVILAAVASGTYSLSQKLTTEGNAAEFVEAIPTVIAAEASLDAQSSESSPPQISGDGLAPLTYSDESDNTMHELLGQQPEFETPHETSGAEGALEESDCAECALSKPCGERETY